jgi:uncharacterized damage-inducible protein DinB
MIERQPEPWLRGTLNEVPVVHRAVLHALELAEEDLSRWCGPLTAAELNARPAGVPSVAFQLRHVTRSIDRLLTYAENRQLNEEQFKALRSELDGDAPPEGMLAEARAKFVDAARRILALVGEDLETPRTVGRQRRPTRLGALLVHIADHTQRHVGQAITTTKIVRGSTERSRAAE